MYVEQCKLLGHVVQTFDKDPLKHADYWHADQLRKKFWDMVIVATPNYTHEEYIRSLCKQTPIMLVEKPGLENPLQWVRIRDEIKPCKLIMVKNNLYRDFTEVKTRLPATRIDILWVNKNRVPQPGRWFTDKSRAWAGVSYDLMPHLLHMMLGFEFSIFTMLSGFKYQHYKLEDIDSTDYGEVFKEGVYDVDDHCIMSYYTSFGTRVNLIAAWKTDHIKEDRREIHIKSLWGPIFKYRMELCPNHIYGKMIQSILDRGTQEILFQTDTDTWVLEQISQCKQQRFNLQEVLP